MKLVAYYRVSTDKQGASGLGLEAQRAACEAMARQRGGNIVAEYIEVESGRRKDRPELVKAVHHAQITGAALLVAKLDRLARNARFLLELRDSGLRLMFADMPEADSLTVTILAAVAEREAEMISARTKAALAAAKARGVKLGKPENVVKMLAAGHGNAAALKAKTEKADTFAERLRPILMNLGDMSLAKQANALNGMGIPTPRGSKWFPASVKALRDRLAADN